MLHKGTTLMALGPANCRYEPPKNDAAHDGGPPYSISMRRAFTLPEIMLVLAVAAILVGIAIPRLSAALDSIEVEAAASHIVAAHQRARLLAVTHSQVVILSIDPAELTIRRRGEPTPLWSEAGPEASGVTLEGPGHQFTFIPEGLTLGLSNATLRVARGAAYRTVVVSRLGRIRIVR